MAERKRLTKKETALRARAKKELQAEGLLPPDKPRLNRKKFAREVMSGFEETMSGYEGLLCLRSALCFMVSKEMRTVSSEQVGVLKLLKIAMELRKLEKLREDGGEPYTVGEYIDKIVIPIMEL